MATWKITTYETHKVRCEHEVEANSAEEAIDQYNDDEAVFKASHLVQIVDDEITGIEEIPED